MTPRRDGTRLRWWLWRQVIRVPAVCTANAHSRIIGRYRDRSLLVDGVCRSDLARNGACWCGKLRAEPLVRRHKKRPICATPADAALSAQKSGSPQEGER